MDAHCVHCVLWPVVLLTHVGLGMQASAPVNFPYSAVQSTINGPDRDFLHVPTCCEPSSFPISMQSNKLRRESIQQILYQPLLYRVLRVHVPKGWGTSSKTCFRLYYLAETGLFPPRPSTTLRAFKGKTSSLRRSSCLKIGEARQVHTPKRLEAPATTGTEIGKGVKGIRSCS